MGEINTKPSEASVTEFVATIEDPKRKEDIINLINIMKDETREDPVLWGGSMIGFGNYHYKYSSGHKGDYFITGLASRKQASTIYLMCGLEMLSNELTIFGKYKVGKGCLYIKNLEDIDIKVLRLMIRKCYDKLNN